MIIKLSIVQYYFHRVTPTIRLQLWFKNEIFSLSPWITILTSLSLGGKASEIGSKLKKPEMSLELWMNMVVVTWELVTLHLFKCINCGISWEEFWSSAQYLHWGISAGCMCDWQGSREGLLLWMCPPSFPELTGLTFGFAALQLGVNQDHSEIWIEFVLHCFALPSENGRMEKYGRCRVLENLASPSMT